MNPEPAEKPSEKSSKIGNIARETRGLLADIKEWIDLRVQLLQFEVEERVTNALQKVISLAVVLVMALFTILFALIGLAEALGTWLGHSAYGYLGVALLLVICTGLANWSRRATSEEEESNSEDETVAPTNQIALGNSDPPLITPPESNS